jgi:hypothetical protein
MFKNLSTPKTRLWERLAHGNVNLCQRKSAIGPKYCAVSEDLKRLPKVTDNEPKTTLKKMEIRKGRTCLSSAILFLRQD